MAELDVGEMADGKLRRLLAQKETFNCAEIDGGDIALSPSMSAERPGESPGN